MQAIGKWRWASGLAVLGLCLIAAVVWAQQPQQEVPDAPSALRPPPPPAAPLPAKPAPQKPSEPPADQQAPAPEPQPPAPTITTVPPGSVPADEASSRDQLYTLKANVNFVLVPVTVKDDSERLVSGLLPKDFTVLEDGVQQKLSFFTSDPFSLSAAVIFDLGMPDVAVQKVNQTFPALAGAFSQFDEVSLYTYSGTVSRVADFSAVNQKLTATLNQMKTQRGRNNGPPVLGGPLGPGGPMINGRPVDPGGPIVITPPKESRVLNDAILAAALDLSKRDRARRKIIFLLSDGREYQSKAGYSDVLKVLLSNEITVYAIGVEGAAIPLYNKLQKLRLPRFGYSDILPKYASATGGEVFTEFSRDAVESAYARTLADARNQYTLGYHTRATPSGNYRQIEVRVRRPNLRVYAKDGYYPAPPGR